MTTCTAPYFHFSTLSVAGVSAISTLADYCLPPSPENQHHFPFLSSGKMPSAFFVQVFQDLS